MEKWKSGKDELANTAIQITCIDRNGNEVKRVTSTSGDVEDPEQEENGTTGNGSTENGGTQNGGGTNSGGNTGGNSGGNTGSGPDDNGYDPELGDGN